MIQNYKITFSINEYNKKYFFVNTLFSFFETHFTSKDQVFTILLEVSDTNFSYKFDSCYINSSVLCEYIQRIVMSVDIYIHDNEISIKEVIVTINEVNPPNQLNDEDNINIQFSPSALNPDINPYDVHDYCQILLNMDYASWGRQSLLNYDSKSNLKFYLGEDNSYLIFTEQKIGNSKVNTDCATVLLLNEMIILKDYAHIWKDNSQVLSLNRVYRYYDIDITNNKINSIDNIYGDDY